MTRDKMLRTLAAAQAFTAQAMRHLIDGDMEGFDNALFFAGTDLARACAARRDEKVEADLPVVLGRDGAETPLSKALRESIREKP